jgi:hypothetical protein
MLGKFGSILPNIGKSVGRARDAFCQTLAKTHEICRTLANCLPHGNGVAFPMRFGNDSRRPPGARIGHAVAGCKEDSMISRNTTRAMLETGTARHPAPEAQP